MELLINNTKHWKLKSQNKAPRYRLCEKPAGRRRRVPAARDGRARGAARAMAVSSGQTHMSAQGCERRWSWAGGVTKLNVAGGSQACGIAVAVRAAGVSGTGEWCRASPVQRPSAPRCPPDARAMRPPDATVCRRSQKPPELTTPKYYFLNCKYTKKTFNANYSSLT